MDPDFLTPEEFDKIRWEMAKKRGSKVGERRRIEEKG